MGSTAGLERLDLVIPKLVPYVDVLMGTRGTALLRVTGLRQGIALRSTSRFLHAQR